MKLENIENLLYGIQPLNEQDKSRFLKPLWDKFSGGLEDIQVTYQELLDFVNKDDPLLKRQFSIRNMSWTVGDEASRFVAIIRAYITRQEINQQKNIEKAAYRQKTIINMIKAEGLVVREEGQPADDSCDFVHLSSLDNEKFDFLVPMSYTAHCFCDSAKAGGEGAKWCTGYKQDKYFYDLHIKDYRQLFIFAFNKEAFKQGKKRDQNTLKYMITISENPNQTEAWLQTDNEDETIEMRRFKKVFGRDIIDMITTFGNSILRYDNIYSRSQEDGVFYSVEDGKPVSPFESATFEELHESYDDEDEEIKRTILKLWPQFAKKAGIDKRIQNLQIKFENIDTLELNAAATTDMELVDKDLKLGIAIDPIIFCFKTERLIGVLIHEMAHAEIVYELYDKYINGEIDFDTLKEGCKQNQNHFEPWKKAATYISERNDLNPDYATITEIDFEDDDIYNDLEASPTNS